ncbi:MAG TPA: type II toxin-antitoxin system HicA family toxin [Spirochaetota bacterium]|nr:type II toxin-antitoxin system HicA family toxin [Spirochaetota bacterium]HPJ37174.1 type II toxin-antitoxin system HicA family toxin [Spirochaetota bacterium]HPQ52530.1 type II toxin-antitoxin system HicA family toxin [Spirochaetota bacterium]
MPKLPVLSGKEVINILQKKGFEIVRQRGSHVSLQRILDKEEYNVVVPLHNELARGTLMSIIRQSGLEKNDFNG